MEKIIIYTQTNCHYCKTLKDELDKNNIKFQEKTTNEFREEWDNVVALTTLPMTPTVYFKNNYFVSSRDFTHPAQLIQIINNFKVCTFDETTMILERIKTLNYNIAMAFGNTDKILNRIEQQLKQQTDGNKSNN
tara:strand:- start:151 stop:552 length:402 start_codon:yes stop_codon:yes gene_type:complete